LRLLIVKTVLAGCFVVTTVTAASLLLGLDLVEVPDQGPSGATAGWMFSAVSAGIPLVWVTADRHWK
jgi:hypothetical protein